MKTMRWNGERWYEDQRSLWQRLRQWFVWVGGWERPVRADVRKYRWELTADYSSKPLKLREPFPTSILGHRMTFFGGWIQMRTRHGYVVWSFKDARTRHRWSWGYCYVSRDGTPGGAHHWLWGWRYVYNALDPKE